MDCIFCKIINKEIPGEIIYEGESAVAVLDIHPIAPGHAMVLPRVHAQNIIELPDEEIGRVFLAVKKVAEKILLALGPDGFTMGINHGRVSGQEVDHLHIHIVPRWNGDGGGSIHSVVQNPPKESVEEIRKKIISE